MNKLIYLCFIYKDNFCLDLIILDGLANVEYFLVPTSFFTATHIERCFVNFAGKKILDHFILKKLTQYHTRHYSTHCIKLYALYQRGL